MKGWASLDYEPTPNEAWTAFSDLLDGATGHGRIVIIPCLEKWIWSVEGVYWSERRVLDDGRISIGWMKP
jgi:hypothetical protein